MQTYFAIVHRDENSAYGVWFPDLPGCFAAGDTEDEALASARKSLMLYAEDADDDGEVLPAARSLADLRRDPEVLNALDDGEAFFVAVPLIRNTGRTKRVNLELDVALIEMIDHVRRDANLTRKAWFEQLARNCVFAYFTGGEKI